MKPSRFILLLVVFGLLMACTSLVAATGDLYVVDQGTSPGTGSIDIYTPNAGFSMLASNLYDPFCLAFDSSNNLFVGDASGNIYRYGANGSNTTFTTGLQNPVSLAFDKSGTLFVSDHASSEIIRFNPDGSQSLFATNINNLYGLAFDGNGNLFASSGSSILKFNTNGTSNVFVSASEGVDGGALAFDRAGYLYTSGADAGHSDSPAIVRFTPDGVGSVFATGLNYHADSLAFDNGGDLLTTVGNGITNTIYKIDPTGTATEFAGRATPYAQYLAFEGATLPVAPPLPFQITSIVRTNVNDLLIAWNTIGLSNIVQVSPGVGAGGSFSTGSFTEVTNIVVTTTTTNFWDIGAGTNSPTRFYRIRSPQ
jgi:hypothetical protein